MKLKDVKNIWKVEFRSTEDLQNYINNIDEDEKDDEIVTITQFEYLGGGTGYYLWLRSSKEKVEKTDDNIKNALNIAFSYAQIDGAHHKLWVIDQMVRNLLKTQEAYEEFRNRYSMVDGKKEYDWDMGTAP